MLYVYGPICVTHKTILGLPIHILCFGVTYSAILAGLLPFSFQLDWKELAVQCLKFRFSGSTLRIDY